LSSTGEFQAFRLSQNLENTKISEQVLGLVLEIANQGTLELVMDSSKKPKIPNRMPKQANYSLAQSSNFLPITAALYDVWRNKSISLLTRENYSLEREFNLMLEWLKVQPKQTFLDVGTSTGNYARVLAKAGASVRAIDISKAFLERAAQNNDKLEIVFEQANAEALPYPDSSFDGATLGATLNEFFHTNTALSEIARVLKPGGKLFMMYLCESDSSLGRLVQLPFKLSGVRFPNREAVREYLSSLGFERPRAEVRRAVAFELFVKTGRIDTGIQMPERKLAREPGKPARDTLG
jgi:ubiquinone/menaquinone biosynthesis C-methylase UbiE